MKVLVSATKGKEISIGSNDPRSFLVNHIQGHYVLPTPQPPKQNFFSLPVYVDTETIYKNEMKNKSNEGWIT